MSLNASAGPARFIVDHWRGDHGLAFTVLVTVLGFRVVLGYLQSLLPDSPALVLIGACVVANVLLLIWQIVGCVRASERYLLRTGDMIPVWGSYLAITAALVLTSVQTANMITSLGPSPAQPVAGTAPRPELPISADGETITLSGNIDFALNSAFVEALAIHRGLRRVILSSDGGYIFAARAIAANITRNGLDTHVDLSCNSACTLAFMAGDARTLAPGARLGFHSYQMEAPDKVSILDIGAEMERDRIFFAGRGVSSGFLDKVFQAGHGDIWFPSHAELHEAGVTTGR